MILWIKKFDLRRLSYQAIELVISGKIEADSLQPFILHFFIEKSSGPEGPWQKIAWKPMYVSGDFGFTYIDYGNIKYDLFSEDYYRISCRYQILDTEVSDVSDVQRPTPEEYQNMNSVIIRLPENDFNWEFDNKSLLNTEDWHKRKFVNESAVKRYQPHWGETSNKIKRVFRISQKFERYFHVHGLRCWIFKKNQIGPHCPACWDSDKEMLIKSNCTLCVGTGWAHPFVTPIRVMCNLYTPSKLEQRTPMGVMVINNYKILLPGYPEVLPEDTIVIPDMHLVFTVEGVDSNPLYGFTTYQFAEVNRLPQNDVKYLLLRIIEQLEKNK